jgi:hypothetical protein
MTALQWLRRVHHFGAGGFMSGEKLGTCASNSELGRWVKQNALRINGKAVQPDTWIDLDELESAVLFAKNPDRRVTIV